MDVEKELLIEPDPITLYVHNHNVLGVSSLIFFLVSVATYIAGYTIFSIFIVYTSVMALVLRTFVCGWVHNFAAYYLLKEES